VLRRSLQAVAAAALISTTATAADLPSRVAVPAPVLAPPVFTWTGFYAGTLTGYAFSDNQVVRTRGNNTGAGGLTDTMLNVAQGRRPAALRIDQDGLTSLGGGIGYDHQFTPGAGLVVGIAADATWMNLDRRRGYSSPPQVANGFIPELSGFRQNLEWMGTVRGRVGYAFDRLLVYGTGGFAYGDVTYRAAFLRNTDAALVYFGRYQGIETGFVYGGGIEYAIPQDSFLARFNLLSYLNLIQSQAITFKVEYLRYDLGSRNVLVANVRPGGPTGTYTSRFNTEGNLIRGGFTYRFGGL
jgi:outer membrane immunogenic protein